MGRYGPSLAAGLIDRAGIEPGRRALDVGCGPGALTTALVDVCGASSVAAVDPSEPFVEACRERAAGADVRVAGAERLPFGDAEFDAALSQLVINFLADAEGGVREMARVTRPAGLVAAAVWDYAGGMTLLRTFWDAAAALDPEGAGGLDEGRTMRFCQPEELADLWRGAALARVETAPLMSSATYESFDSLWEPFTHGVGPSGAYVASLDPYGQVALRDELHRRLGAPDGPFELSARAWSVTGMVR